MSKLFAKNAEKILIVWIIILAILYSTLSIVRHNNFQSGGFDLGIYDQAVWQYSQFLFPYNTIKERMILGDHLTLTLPLLAPLFYLWDDVRILLIFQALWICLSAIPIYKLSEKRGFSKFTSIILSVIYSLFYGFQFAVFFDLHPVVFAVGLLAWLIFFLETGQKKLFLTSLILILLTQENMGFAITSLGFIYIFKKRFRRLSLLFIIGGIIISFISVKAITFFSPVGYEHFPPDFSFNPLTIIASYIDAEEKLLVWLYSLSWFSFLPMFSPGSMLAVIFDLAQYFHAGVEKSRMWSPFTHHRAILAVFLTLGTLDIFEYLRKKGLNILWVSIGMLAFMLFLQYFFHFPLNKLTKKEFLHQEPWMIDNRHLIATVPLEASIATQQNLVPHLSHRKEIYLIWPRLHDFDNNLCGQKTCWWFDFAGKPEYLVVNLSPTQWVTQLLASPENFIDAVENMEKAGVIIPQKEIGSARLYRIIYR